MDKKVVRASYENCLNGLARLNAYATSNPSIGITEINVRQDILAADDLIFFCIHARRLLENVGCKELSKKIFIDHANGTSFSLWKIIGHLIHHDELEILRCNTRMRYLEDRLNGKTHEEALERIIAENKLPYSEPIAPRIVFKADQTEHTIMNLETFLRLFSKEILPEIINHALNQGLDLRDNPLQDLEITEELRLMLSRL